MERDGEGESGDKFRKIVRDQQCSAQHERIGKMYI
jgi:hypothetical protein